MRMTVPSLPSLTSEVPFDNLPSPTQTQATQRRSREAEMAAQYYAKRVEETSRQMVLPALAAAIAPGPQQDGRYRSPYASTESHRPPNVLAPIAPMAPMAPMSMSQHGTPEPGQPRHLASLSTDGRTSSESQTDEHHEAPKPITLPGNNQYTPGVHRVSHPCTPQPTGPSDGTKPPRPRPHVCLTCQRTFARREHLNRHELSHTKEKPFECNECSRCFSRRDLLLRHKQKLHITNPYVRPRDRVKSGDGRDEDDELSMQPMAPMRSEDDGINVPIAVHPSGRVQHGGPNQQDAERGGPSQMAMAHMRPALPPPSASQDHGHTQQQGPPQQKPTGSAASLYYQKQDYDLSQVDLSRFRSFSRSPRPPGAMPTGPPQVPPPPGYVSGGPSPLAGQPRGPPPPQGAPVPVSPHQIHREPLLYAGGPGPIPINHDGEESGFHIPFAKRPRRDTDGRSRNSQTLRHQAGPPPGPAQGYTNSHPHFPPPGDRYEPPHSLLDQLAIAAVPNTSRSYASFEEQPYDPRGSPPSQHDIEIAQASQREIDVWRSPGGTHRVVQFERPLPKIQTAEEARESLAAPGQHRSPSRKRGLQEGNDHQAEVASSAQGGYRRSMRRALSMSMEDGQRPVIPITESPNENKSKSKAADGKKGKKAPNSEEDRENKSGKPNVRYVKAASSRSSLKEKKEEKKSTSPVRGRKPSAKAKTAQEEEETPKRGRGRPPKSASKARPATAKRTQAAKGKKSAKAVEEEVEETESEEEEELSEDEQAAVEEQLLQEEKRVTRGLRGVAAKKVKESKKDSKEDKEEEMPGRTFRSVRLQAKHMK